MKTFLSLILFLSLSIAGFAQQDYPDSGFTNKVEAKNLIVNGKKEGKWVKYYYADGMKIPTDTNPDFYNLSIYKRGKRYGISRMYYWYSRKLLCETHYTKGKKNGIEKTYYSNGKIKSKITYLKGEAQDGTGVNYDENGNEIK